MKEKAIENQILAYLKLKGFYVWKNESQGTYDVKIGTYRRKNGPGRLLGTSDILGVMPNGRFMAIEVKSATGRLSDYQKDFLEQVTMRGGLAFMVGRYLKN